MAIPGTPLSVSIWWCGAGVNTEDGCMTGDMRRARDAG
jgi:hypothetical protein